MKSQDLKKLILSLSQDVVFTFNSKSACINPWNTKKFEVGFGDKSKTYSNIDDLMTDKFFDGYSLNEISESIEIF